MNINTVKNYIENNSDLFHRQLIINQTDEQTLCITFKSVMSYLKTYINTDPGDIIVSIDYPDEEYCWDMPFSLEVLQAVTEDGRHYCQLCEEPQELFPSEWALWENHLQYWIAWLDRVFATPHEIRLCGQEGSSTFALVVPLDKNSSPNSDMASIRFPLDIS